MSLLRNVVLEASSHTNTKTVFRIPSDGHLIMPELRLVNFGISATVNGDGAETFAYSSGLYSLIKSVRLYGNNILIDQCMDCQMLLATQNLSSDSSVCYDIKQQLLASNVNMDADVMLNRSGLKPVITKLLGRLDLMSVLPFLQNIPAIWDIPNELRVEIEYNTDPLIIFSDDGNAHQNNFEFTVSQPTMVYSEEMNQEQVMQFVKSPPTVLWLTWEREFIQALPSGTLNQPRVRAFDNKYVDSLLIAKQRTSFYDGKLGLGYSTAYPGQSFNYILNGRKQLAFSGHDTPARSVAAVADMKGDFVCPYNAWDTMCDNSAQAVLPALDNLKSKLSWEAVKLQTVVNRLDLEFSTSAIAGNPTIDLWVWGLVSKFMMKDKKGNLIVGYTGNGSSM